MTIEDLKKETAPSAHGPKPAEPPTKRQVRAMATKEKIYNAALTVINEKGFNNVSIEDITTAAHVAKGSFYNHFESKEALVLYSYTRADKTYQQAYEKSAGMDFLNRMVLLMRAYYTDFEKCSKGILKAIIASYYAVPGQNVYGKDRVLLQCFDRLVEQGKAEHALDKEIPNDEYVNMLLSALVGVEVVWCFDSRDTSLADMIERALRIMVRGMMAQGG